MSGIVNPYLIRRPASNILRRRWDPIVAEHVADLDTIFTKRTIDPDDLVKRRKATEMLYLCEAARSQCQFSVLQLAPKVGLSHEQMRRALASEALTAGTNIVADITNFITARIHDSLEIWPRLLATRLVSTQPLTRPEGYVFYRKHYDETGRDLSVLDTFDPDYTEDPGEGQQISKIKTKLTKQLVETGYRKLMHEFSHEMDVALRTQHGLSVEDVNDAIMDWEMGWEIDRTVIDRLVDFAGSDYYFDPDRDGTYDDLAPTEQQAYDKDFLRVTMSTAEVDMQSRVYRRPNWAIAGNAAMRFLARMRSEWEAIKEGDPNYADRVIQTGSIAPAGKLRGMTVWHDPQLDDTLLLIGHTDPMDPFYAGYIFCPFGAASILTAAWTDPDVLLTKKAQATAFGSVGIRPYQYARIHLAARS